MSTSSHVATVTVTWLLCDQCHTFCDYVTVIWCFPILYLSNNLTKKNKRKIENSLAVLPSHDTIPLSQMATYWLVDLIFKKLKKAKIRQAAKMLLSLRSTPQTMSPYIHNCDSLCTSTDHHLITTYCSTYGSVFVLE